MCSRISPLRVRGPWLGNSMSRLRLMFANMGRPVNQVATVGVLKEILVQRAWVSGEFADNFLEYVFDRHQSLDIAILIDDETETHGTPQSVGGRPGPLLHQDLQPGHGCGNRRDSGRKRAGRFEPSGGKRIGVRSGRAQTGPRELELTLNATTAGTVENRLLCRADANLVAEDQITLEVIAPEIKLSLRGPNRRYLERPATYEISISNPGSAPASDVELVAFLPKGVHFKETNNTGVYDAERHAVFWSVAELPAGGGGDVELTAMPLEAGEQKIRVEGRANAGLVDQRTHRHGGRTRVALLHPIEVGEDTLYEIRVINEGSKTSENIQVLAILPPEMKPLSGEGAGRGVVEGQTVKFEPLARLAPKADDRRYNTAHRLSFFILFRHVLRFLSPFHKRLHRDLHQRSRIRCCLFSRQQLIPRGCPGLFLNRVDLYEVCKPDHGGAWVE